MNQLDQIENRIKEIIEKGNSIVPWADQRAILVSHFCESLRRFLLEEANCLNKHPNELKVFMSSEEVKLWKQQPGWQKKLTDAFIETVAELNCKTDLLPELTLTTRNSLQGGSIVFGIEESSPDHENTDIVKHSKPVKPLKQKSGPETARMLINPEKTIPLDKPVLNLGRRSNNDIVVNDLRVSRLHAQIRETRNGYMIFDVDSTGGTFVNGERISSCQLKSGDVISLAGYTLVFTHDKDFDNESRREITSEFSNLRKSDKS